jgi:hypothetical protein
MFASMKSIAWPNQQKICLLSASLGLLTFATPSFALTTELITNGGFETGDFTGWTTGVQAGSNGSISVVSGTSGPNSGLPTAGPAAGNFYSVTDQNGPGAYFLLQQFSLPSAFSDLNLSFDMFVNDWSGLGPLCSDLDYNNFPNQCARVDILTSTAGPFSTIAADIVASLYVGVDPQGSNPNLYTAYSFGLSSALAGLVGGSTYQLRFAQVDNQSFFNQGVDNVSLVVTTDTQQVPGPLPLFGVAATFCYSRKLRKRIKSSKLPVASPIDRAPPSRSHEAPPIGGAFLFSRLLSTRTEERQLFAFIRMKLWGLASLQASFVMSSSQELNCKTFYDELNGCPTSRFSGRGQ